MDGAGRPREIELETKQGRLAALHWPCKGAPRVFCLHGWLDNAASFVPLAALLPQLDLLAIDLPGHGRSEHRHATTRYHFMDYLWNVDAALDALNWPDCHLLGHSLGAAIAAVYAAGAPYRCRSVTMLDSLGPVSGGATGTADRLRRSLSKNRRGVGVPRSYGTIEEMVEARRKVSKLSKSSARLLCDRAARTAGERLVWRSDPALNWISSLIMTDEQAVNLLEHVEAPVLTFTASEEAPWESREKIEAHKRALAHGRHLNVEGHHHFHMDDPALVADEIRAFIVNSDLPPAATPQTERAT